ncbi:MAG: NAD(P)(+) transhydrogenase (Re/Si-specific) subunit beta, partial [Firmicutes bacterium]|nr:NAD(P)(+) transhydrogenase (Re/Si-specific) subunit beta [Bacillota bacterium]
MSPVIYYILSAVLSAVILYGISLMSKVKTAVRGNQLSAVATAIAIVITLIHFEIISLPTALIIVLVCIAVGGLLGLWLAKAVKMIQMPEMVGMLNGVGGAASALVGSISMFYSDSAFSLATAVLALCVGTFTFTGSFIAAAKLAGVISGRPVIWRDHHFIVLITSILMLLSLVLAFVPGFPISLAAILAAVSSALWGIAIAIRVGGADMPITISLLNSFSGVAGSIAGMAIGDILLVAVGGIVGASGLLLTQIMCRAMNSSLMDILLGKTSVAPAVKGKEVQAAKTAAPVTAANPVEILHQAKKVIIVPGYGMAIAQAQHLVKELADTLEAKGAEVKFAIHPVAGRMPGHMNVLLSEADVSYEQLFEMEEINDEFAACDACIVIGANDVMNPAARDTEDTPISGMPILNVDQAPHILIFNY